MNERVLITRRIPPPAETMLRDAGFVVDALALDHAPPLDVLYQRVRGVAGVIPVLMDRIDEAFLDAAGPALRVVANVAVGIDNIDLEACRIRNVVVANTPGVLTEATADLTWALILATARRILEGDAMVRSGRWTGWRPTELLGRELHDSTLGIVGAGRIGTATARRAAGFGMRLLYAHPRVNAELAERTGATRVAIETLLSEADIVSLHVPYRAENHHLINAERLRLMRDGAILINTARGAIVDEAALIAELRSGRISAGLDVYEREPFVPPVLRELANVVLLPHLGSATHHTRQRMSAMAAENVIAVLQGRPAPNAVA